MKTSMRAALGLDYGTESVRALLVDLAGRELASVSVPYRHGQILDHLPGKEEKLPPHYALQDPGDWLDSAARAVRKALQQSRLTGNEIIGIGVDFTSCTMLPALRDGTPLCLLDQFRGEPLAWPKLWKHHGAQSQTDRINAVARERKETFLQRYGGAIGLEWFFPKILETLEKSPSVYQAAEVWLEAGDWLVWQLAGGDASSLTRSTCQAGYKGMWSAGEGFPSRDFLSAVHPKLGGVLDRLPGVLRAPGEAAGGLTEPMARRFGLPPGVPVSTAIIDAHAGVPGAGAAEAGTLVMVLGTSSCHMLNAIEERNVPGVAGVVKNGILPGYFGYETGQAAVGDAFAWVRRVTGQRKFASLWDAAAKLPAGSEGVVCVDWFNGCRTPLMDGRLTASLAGLTLRHGPAHLFRSVLEASGFGLRWIVELLRENKVPVKRFVATGGLPHHNPFLVQIYADILGAPITIHPSRQGPALGAAILGALAAGRPASGFASPRQAIQAMAAPGPGREAMVMKPDAKNRKVYDRAYSRYRTLADNSAR